MGGISELKKVEAPKRQVEKEVSPDDLKTFKDYYENTTVENRKELDNKFKTYFDEELENDSKLKDGLKSQEETQPEFLEISKSAEIDEHDIGNLNTVINLRDVLKNYPNITNPEYRAVEKMVEDYKKDLDEVQEVIGNPENVEWWDDNHN